MFTNCKCYRKEVKQHMKDWEFWSGIVILNRLVKLGLVGKVSLEKACRSNLSCSYLSNSVVQTEAKTGPKS